MANLVTVPVSEKSCTISGVSSTIEKDRETKQPTGNKLVCIKYVTTQKNKTTGYRDDVVLPVFVPLTIIAKALGIPESEEKTILERIAGKKLVFKTEVAL